MKVFTSYFYQLRFFKPYMIPLSTAVGDPFWYHKNTKNNDVVFLDKNHVVNGLRILPLVPDSTCSNLCKWRDNCAGADPSVCSFLSSYYKQLKDIDYRDFMRNLDSHVSTVCNKLKIDVEPFAVIMVHEAVTNPCSERVIIQRWFADNGLAVSELNPKEY